MVPLFEHPTGAGRSASDLDELLRTELDIALSSTAEWLATPPSMVLLPAQPNPHPHPNPNLNPNPNPNPNMSLSPHPTQVLLSAKERGGQSFVVRIDPAGLPPGVHFARVEARDASDKARGPLSNFNPNPNP